MRNNLPVNDNRMHWATTDNTQWSKTCSFWTVIYSKIRALNNITSIWFCIKITYGFRPIWKDRLKILRENNSHLWVSLRVFLGTKCWSALPPFPEKPENRFGQRFKLGTGKGRQVFWPAQQLPSAPSQRQLSFGSEEKDRYTENYFGIPFLFILITN